MMAGILVHGNNHFILSGPEPSEAQAVALAREFSLTTIGSRPPTTFGEWTIREKEFRENLEWAVFVPGNGDISPGVTQLLQELAARGVELRRSEKRVW